MSTPQEAFQQFLDQQRADYQRALPEKIAQVQMLWQAVDAGGPSAPPLVDLERQAHTLAGTAGTLGFREVSVAARALELLLEQASEAGPALTPTQRPDIVQAVAALQASLPPP
ncbi:Hpt domain-containing protein [Polaromonas sp. SM01]|uniref:Hpt domain-containing protein n=1 Tax=Polaromonas sp. SM01 TaxID=3085630 RepID=UPI002982340C|nr:Hpt domain-containing protein [Polaromonas sp. SM01]MDW5440971.1 Hpt domain-containing protein [Polaromonas sp. SM01]